jgi:hypothetical protein
MVGPVCFRRTRLVNAALFGSVDRTPPLEFVLELSYLVC